MSQPLENYYDRELEFLQEQAAHFAQRFPAEAGALLPREDLTSDPHLERMMEGFALLAGRIRHKVDSELPELTEGLLQVMYPHLLRIVPSLAIAQMDYGPLEKCPREGKTIERGVNLCSQLVGIPPVVCQYRTGYPVTLWPVRVVKASIEPGPFSFNVPVPSRTVAALRLELECVAGTFADLPLDRLRFFLNGPRHLVAMLYEVLFNHTQQVVFRSFDKTAKARPLTFKPAECLRQVGFEREEGLLPFPVESFVGHRLLTEFLSFPEKFLFVDMSGWQQARVAGFGNKLEVILFLNRTHPNLEQGVSKQTFLLGCTPIINLFSKSAEPLAWTHLQTDYRVVPSRHEEKGMEVFSVDSVVGLDPVGRKVKEFRPFFQFLPGQPVNTPQAFWHQIRRDSPEEDDLGTDVYLILVDQEFDPRLPPETVLDIQTTCTNREVPGRFQRGGDPLYLDRREPSPVSIRCLSSPTAPLRPTLRRQAHWRLLSQNSLNHVTLNHPHEGREVLQEMLRLCDFSSPGQQLAHTVQQSVEGILGLSCRRAMGYRAGPKAIGVCQGLEFTLELDEKKYVGVGMFLFASVLERFLGYYAAVNAFSQLIAKNKQGEGIIKKWPPRAMDQQIV